MSAHQKNTSKFLSLILRHKPEVIGIELDSNGWANTGELLEKMAKNGHPLSFDELEQLVAGNDKRRFVFSEDHSRIRAAQGHSIDVDLELPEATPPAVLYHGTARKNIESIRQQGLVKGSRHHVHLSFDTEIARKVGMRYGQPVVLTIDAGAMHGLGFTFFESANGVWLTDGVPPQFIFFP